MKCEARRSFVEMWDLRFRCQVQCSFTSGGLNVNGSTQIAQNLFDTHTHAQQSSNGEVLEVSDSWESQNFPPSIFFLPFSLPSLLSSPHFPVPLRFNGVSGILPLNNIRNYRCNRVSLSAFWAEKQYSGSYGFLPINFQKFWLWHDKHITWRKLEECLLPLLPLFSLSLRLYTKRSWNRVDRSQANNQFNQRLRRRHVNA